MKSLFVVRRTANFAMACALGAALLNTSAGAAELTARPDALLSVDANRSAVVEKIAIAWARDIPANQTTALKAQLSGLRADQLLAASMAASFDGVLEILQTAPQKQGNASPALGFAPTLYATQSELLNNAKPATQNSLFLNEVAQNAATEKSKAVGEPDRDLIYTPVTPCRLFDTRAGQASALGTLGGVMANQTTRTLAAGGQCGIPTGGVKSIFLTFHAYTFNPSVLGVITFQKTGAGPTGLSATWTGGAWATGTTISGTLDNGSFDVFVGNGAAMTADMVVDVVGYFQSPNRTGDGLRVITATDTILGSVPNVVNGDSTNIATKAPPGVTCVDFSRILVGGTVSGGSDNRVSDVFSTVSGGTGNTAGNYGCINPVDGGYATVGGGATNIASGNYSTIAGGESNSASASRSTVGGGLDNTANGNYSTIPGGYQNTASAPYSFAAGYKAKATTSGSFVWADAAPGGFDFDPAAQGSFGANVPNMFHARATGGVRFVTGIGAGGAITTGCFISPVASAWSCTSDRNLKEKVKVISPRNVLEKLVTMPVSTWSLIGSNVRQMGPMAQDFFASFGLGTSDTSINSIDAQGVAFAAIQGLNQKLTAETKAKDATIAAMQRELNAIKKKLGL